MAKKGKSRGNFLNKKSNNRILNAFEIAEQQENGIDNENANDNSDDGESLRDGVMDARKFMTGDQGQGFEDEEIDSDEAFGSDDDFDVLESKFSQTIRDKEKKKKLQQKKSKGRPLPQSESEDDGYASIDEDQLVPLSVAWDMDDVNLKKAEGSNDKNKDVVLDDNWDTESSEDDSDESSDDEEESDDDKEKEEEEEEEDIFEDASSNEEDIDLSNTVSHLKNQIKQPEKEKRRLITEATEENEFNVPNSGNKLSLNDMVAAVDQSVSKNAILVNDDGDDNDSKLKPLDTPLPKRIQERHNRLAAYDLTKEEVGKWEDTVQQNRRAEVLRFPMNPQTKHNDVATTFKSDYTPANDMETKVHNLLQTSALTDDKKESTFEDLAVAKLSPEEMKKRTQELRLMRELMFRDEKRAKRLKKIKSKSYRRIKKKERMKEEQLVEGSDESDGEDHDRKRAEERMNLKHKTNSNWARSVIKSGLSKDASNREELEEMLRQGEKLRSKQLGHDEGEPSDDNVSDIEKDYAQDNQEEDDQQKQKLGKGVLGMDFMKAAEERKRQENLQEIEELKTLEQGGDRENFEDQPSNSINKSKNQGRRIYTPSASAQKKDNEMVNEKVIEEIRDDEASNLTTKLQSKPNKINKKPDTIASSEPKSPPPETESTASSNPWLSTGEVKKASKINVIDKDSSKMQKAANKIKKKTKGNNELPVDDDFDVGQTLEMNHHDSGDEETFQQEGLIKEAFAGDNVVTEFKKEKRKVAKEEGDKTEDLTLPGWGDWAGGNKKLKKRKITRKIDGVVQQDKRKDKNMKDVIINERVNKKNLKYQSSDVPYPYETREQYERALRMPVGQAWTSKETHQKLTMPRIITKQGSVIDPLKAPFK